MKTLLTCVLAFLLVVTLGTAAQAQYFDVTQPTDPVLIVNGTNDGDTSSGAPPAGEQPVNAINNTLGKYLNFLDLGSGIIVTPSNPAPVTALRLYPANDAPDRDPASYLLEGSASTTGPWTLISQGNLALPTARNNPPNFATISIDFSAHQNQLVTFSNTTPYANLRLTFPTLRNAGATNSMQIAEVEFLAVPEPSTIALAGMGLIGLVVAVRRRRK
jgi:hypothetical protein